MNFAIRITMSRSYFEEKFKILLNGKTAISSQGDEWQIITKTDKQVEIGQYPSFLMAEAKGIH